MLRCLVVTTSGLRVTPHGRPGYPLLRECNGCPARGVQPSLRGVNGVSTHCGWSGWRRAGRPDEPERLQASLRGCNAERRRSAGLLGDRTHSESNGFPGCDGLCGGRTRSESLQLSRFLSETLRQLLGIAFLLRITAGPRLLRRLLPPWGRPRSPHPPPPLGLPHRNAPAAPGPRHVADPI